MVTRLWPSRSIAIFLGLGLVLGVLSGAIVAWRSATAGGNTAAVREDTTETAQMGDSIPDDPGDVIIEFPPQLAGFDGRPTDIALDSTGGLWTVWQTLSGEMVLSNWSADREFLAQYELPAEATAPRPRLEIYGVRPVLSVANQLVLFDSHSKEYSTVSTTGEGSVVEMRLWGDSVFVTRLGDSAISRVSLDSGATDRIDVPASFGGFDDFLVSDQTIWLLKTTDTLDGPPSHIGALDIATGALRTIDLPVHSALAHEGGLFVLTWNPDGLAYVDKDGGIHPIDSKSLDGSFIGRLGPNSGLGISPDGKLWMYDQTANAIATLDPASGEGSVYSLPLLHESGEYFSCPQGITCPEVWDIATEVTGMAVASDGNVYFADATLNRLGVIRPQ